MVTMARMLITPLMAGFAFIANPAWANCSCQCVEGAARTVCTSVDEARADPSACGVLPHRVACEPASQTAAPPRRFDPPPGAKNCHAVRMWDPRRNDYSVIAKVCDPKRDAAAKG